MAESKILTLAKQGNPKAIAILMNHSLRPKQITVEVSVADLDLSVVATAIDPPDRPFMVNFVRQGMKKLDIETIQRVNIQGHGKGSSAPAWKEMLVLRDPPPEPIEKLPTTPPPPPPKVSKPSPKRKATPPKRSTRRPTTLGWILTILGAFFFLVSIALTLGLAVPIKVFTALLAEHSLYQVQILGDVLRGLELAELFNILVFAILGMGLGLATALLPKWMAHRISVILLIVSMPVIFSLGSFIRYTDWVNNFSLEEALSRNQTVEITNAYLMNQVGAEGFVGFYLYTARYPILPMDESEMKNVSDLEERVTARITRVIKISPDNLSKLFSICIWGIRVFYFGLSVVTAIAHFGQGEILADQLAKREISQG